MRPKDAMHWISRSRRWIGGVLSSRARVEYDGLHARRTPAVVGRKSRVRRCTSSAALAAALLVSLWVPGTLLAEGEDCGDLRNAFGPYDYRTIPATPLSLVEAGHFTPNVEYLIKGQSGYLGADLDYTLRAIPNHPRAIVSMANLGFRDKKDPPKGARYTVDCWFDRAIRFAPDDPKIRTAHGYYLSRKGKHQEAVDEFRYALELGADDGNTHYNLGLAHFNLKQYDEALKQAKLADERGFPLQGLKNKLKAVDKWTD
jgi:hypothetical protein